MRLPASDRPQRDSSFRLSRAIILALLIVATSLFPGKAFAQGETTSAIVGQVSDATGAVVPGASITITNQENGLKRSAKTDDAGRFNFPQLKPGAYAVKVEAQGFQPKQDNVVSGLGQKQTVDFTLKVAQSDQSVEVTSEAPLINTATANTTTTLSTTSTGGPAEPRWRPDLSLAVCRGSAHQYRGQRQ